MKIDFGISFPRFMTKTEKKLMKSRFFESVPQNRTASDYLCRKFQRLVGYNLNLANVENLIKKRHEKELFDDGDEISL